MKPECSTKHGYLRTVGHGFVARISAQPRGRGVQTTRRAAFKFKRGAPESFQLRLARSGTAALA
jgi:hypothetical protein